MQFLQLLQSPLHFFAINGKRRFGITAVDKRACPVIVQRIVTTSYLHETLC